MKRLIAFALIFIAIPAYALPTISGVSGTLANGQTLTISGAAFGTKAVAAPLRYDDFEGGTNGGLLQGPYTRDVDESYSNFVTRPNSTLSAQCSFLGSCAGDYSSNFFVAGVTPNLDKVYMDAWYYGRYSPGSFSRNHKLFRIHSNIDLSPNLYFNVYCSAFSVHVDQDGPGPAASDAYINLPRSAMDYLNGKWTHIQGYFQHSTGSALDGITHIWVDNVLYVNDNNWQNAPDGSTHWDSFYFGNYLGHGSDASCVCAEDNWTYWDNAYLDTTQAHVEIGDAPTYNACTDREIQIPSSWTATSINVKLNQGAMADFAGKYLYVTDRAGLINAAGFPLTGGGPPSTCSSGGGGGGPPPNVVLVQSPAPAVFGAVTSGNLTLPSAPAVGDYIFVCTVNGVSGGPRTVASVTDNLGNVYSNAGGGGGGLTWGATRRNEIWYAKNATNAACTITVTMSGITDLSFTASEFSGLAASQVVDVVSGSGGSGAIAQTVFSTTNANDLVVGVMSHGNATVTLTPGSGYSQLGESELTTFMPIHSEYQLFTSTGSKVADVAAGASVTWGVYAAAFKAGP